MEQKERQEHPPEYDTEPIVPNGGMAFWQAKSECGKLFYAAAEFQGCQMAEQHSRNRSLHVLQQGIQGPHVCSDPNLRMLKKIRASSF